MNIISAIHFRGSLSNLYGEITHESDGASCLKFHKYLVTLCLSND